MTKPDDIIIHRSKKRKKTIQATYKDNAIHIYLPANLSTKEEEKWITTMTEKVKKRHNKRRLTNDVDLYTRSQKLNKTYFDGELDYSIQFVTNQHKRYGSCSPHNNTIRISDKVGAMPQWVQDYVIVHELAHLIQPNHSKEFWNLVNAYPYTERARGYLIAKGNTDEIEE